MTRAWVDWLDDVGEVVPLSLLVLVLLVLAAIVGILLAFDVRKWWRPLRGRPKTGKPAATQVGVPDEPVEDDALPDLPVAAFVTLADRLAAEGRFAEAVRERLRAIIRDLVDRGLVEHRPGWTVTELAAAAAAARPPVRAPLEEAARIFSDVWYGQRPATAVHDTRMRELAAAVDTALRQPLGAAS